MMFALTKNFCKKELNYIKKAFCANNNYPKWVKNFTASQTTAKTPATATTTTTTTTNNNSRCSRKESLFITPL